jgi:hypothetical protein
MKMTKPASHQTPHASHPATHGDATGHAPEDEHIFVPPLKPGDPGPVTLKKIKPPYVAIFLPRRKAAVPVLSVGNPAPDKSFGYVNRFVEITKMQARGTLVIQLDPESLGTVATETLRVFRWISDTHAFELVHQSGLGQTRDYVWATITEPGIYSVIGINTEPLVLRTLALLRWMQQPLRLAGTSRNPLQKRICELMLCNPKLHRRMRDSEFARSLVEDNLHLGLPGKWRGGLPPRISKNQRATFCRICAALGNPASPPELEILPMSQAQALSDAGEWSVLPLGPQGAQILAVHAALIHTEKVVYFSGSEHDETQHDTNVDHSRVWIPSNNSIQLIGSPTHDLFCSGHAFLGSGRLVVAGGTEKWKDVPDPKHTDHYTGLRNTCILNPSDESWISASPMKFQRGKTVGGGRWYPALVTLSNGRVFTMCGHPEKSDTRHKNNMVEAFKENPLPAGSWADLGDQPDTPQNYARLHLLPGGRVFCSTPMAGKSKKCDPSTGTWTNVCTGPGNLYGGIQTSAVLLPLLPSENYNARVMVVGDVQPRILDLGNATPSWQDTAQRQPPSPVRRHGCAVLLPDSSVLLVGGCETNLDADAVLAAERYDPATDVWSTLATAAVPRNYHSVALLLPDGCVWTAGSNFDSMGGIANRELRMEIFKPPYLFWGARPVITSVPSSMTLPSTFTIHTPQSSTIQSVAMMRCGSVTHAFDADQRYVGLSIQSHTASSLTVKSPPNKKVAPPGYYMLFILDANGVPSIGKIVQIS